MLLSVFLNFVQSRQTHMHFLMEFSGVKNDNVYLWEKTAYELIASR